MASGLLRGAEMSEADVLIEKIAYLKLWLGIMVVTNISVVGWLLVNLHCGKLGTDRRRRDCDLGYGVWNLRLAQTDRKGN